MAAQEKIDIDIFKVVTRAIAESCNLEVMARTLCGLLVSALEVKGATIFARNLETRELEVLASAGLSLRYVNKGPIFFDRSIREAMKQGPVVVSDVTRSDALQYPEEAVREGIGAIVSVPVPFEGRVVGALRLYHHTVWDISSRDLDSLAVLAEIVGLALMYARLGNALLAVKAAVDEAHGVWRPPGAGRAGA